MYVEDGSQGGKVSAKTNTSCPLDTYVSSARATRFSFSPSYSSWTMLDPWNPMDLCEGSFPCLKEDDMLDGWKVEEDDRKNKRR